MPTNWRVSWSVDTAEVTDPIPASAADIRRLNTAARTMLRELAEAGTLSESAAADDVEQAVYLAVLRDHRRLGVSDLIVVDEDATAALPGYPLAEAGTAAYYPVWIAPGGKRGGWSWGPRCSTAAQASTLLATVMADRPLIPIGAVVAFCGGEVTPIRDLIVPAEYREIIALWDALEDMAERMPDLGELPCYWQAWTERGAWRLGSPERDAAACARAVVARVKAAAPTGPQPRLAAQIAWEAHGEPVAKILWPQAARNLVARWDDLWDCTEPAGG